MIAWLRRTIERSEWRRPLPRAEGQAEARPPAREPRAVRRARRAFSFLGQRVRQHGPVLAHWHLGFEALLALIRRGPATPLVDRIFAAVHFVKRNRRLPRRRPLLNDVLYRYKVEGELASPLRRRTTDKAAVKRFVAERVGAEHAVPTLALLRTEREVRAFVYPDRCVIKPTHSSGRTILRSAAEPIDLDLLASWLRHDLYRYNREQHYRGLEAGIIVEPLLEAQLELAIFCYRGEVRLHGIVEKPFRIFGPGWSDLQDTLDSPERGWKAPTKPLPEVPPPRNIAAIERLAAELATGFSLVRVDLYLVGERILVGELTHCHASAGHRFHSLDQERRVSRTIFG